MRNTTKRLLAIAAIVTTVGAFATVNAEYDPNNTNEVPMIATKSVAENNTVTVNGFQIVNQKIMNGDTVMIPLRAVAENLGYMVIWNETDCSIEITRGDFTTTLKIGDTMCGSGENASALELAPTLVDDCTTYVPLSFIGGVLNGRADVLADGSVEINEFKEVVITSVSENADEKYIIVNDAVQGEVIVYIAEETEITKNGEVASFEDLTADMPISVVYSTAMTMSLPPQTTAVKIEIPAEVAEDAVKTVMVTEVLENNAIMVNDPTLGDVMVYVADETKITKNGEVAKFEDITKDIKLNVVYSPAMTMSLPPQTTAVSIEILDESAAIAVETVDFSGVIKEINEDGMVIVDVDNSDMDIALIISEETNIVHAMNRRLYKADDLAKDMKISGKHSAAMTRSIPPQTAAIEIIIAE